MIVMKAGRRKWWVEQLAFSPDGTLVAAPAGMDGVYLLPAFGAADPVEPLPLPTPHAGRVSFSQDGSLLLAVRTELVVVTLADRRAAVVSRVRWGELRACVTADSSRLIVSEQIPMTGDDFDVRSRYSCRPVSRPTDVLWEVEFDGVLRSELLVPPGGDRFLAAEWPIGGARKLYWRSTDDGAVLGEAPHGCGPVRVMSADGRWAAETMNRWAFVYPTPGNPAVGKSIYNGHRRDFTDAAFHPSGRFLAVTSNDQSVRLFDIQTWEIVKAYSWDVGRLRSVCFSSDGTRAAVGSDTGHVVVWDVDL